MPALVQAGSLAEVINLADNPPGHPQDQSLPFGQQPLILYIARVPGCRDVFLTTTKPQQKVVTAQDVQSSLYYMHLSSEHDYRLLRPEVSDVKDQAKQQHKAHAFSDQQTNVGQNPQSFSNLQDTNPKLTPTPYFQLQAPQVANGGTHIARKPVGQGDAPIHRGLKAGPGLPPQRLLGPRSMNQRHNSVQNPILQDMPYRQNIDVRRWSEQPITAPSLPPRPGPIQRYHQDFSNSGLPSQTKEQTTTVENDKPREHCWSWENEWESKRASEAREEMARISEDCHREKASDQEAERTSLTLIRRYNDEQWNVGKLVDAAQDSIDHNDSGHGGNMSVIIMTPGYSRFLTPRNKRDSSLIESVEPVPDSELAGGRPFRRLLQLRRHEKVAHHTGDNSLGEYRNDEATVRPNFDRGHRSSYSSRTSIDDRRGSANGASKGYTIQSPWNGLCEFSTGLGGRSLKCHHTYTSRDPKLGPGRITATVSELRFNLPSSKALGIATPKLPTSGVSRESKRSSFFRGSNHKRDSSSFTTTDVNEVYQSGPAVELEDRLDLSLGQEHAGGGFGGKQAKLGKLIVHADGLQMLDFIVAANMALWWKVYERLT